MSKDNQKDNAVAAAEYEAKAQGPEQPEPKADKAKKPRSEKRQRNYDMTWMALGLLVTLAIITSVINFVSENKARQLIAEFEARNPIPRFVVMDFDGMIGEWREANEPEDRIIRGVALISKMLREDNYVVLDYKAVVTSGSAYNLQNFSLDDIEQMAVKRGMDLDEEVKELLREAEEQAKVLSEQIMKELELQQQQANQYRSQY